MTKRQSPRVGIAVLAAIVALMPGAVPARGWGGEYQTLEGWTIVQLGFLDAPFSSPDAPYKFFDRQYGIRQFCFVSREKFNRIGEDGPAILLRKENKLGVAAIRYDILLHGIIDFVGNIEKVSCPDEERRTHRADPGLPRHPNAKTTPAARGLLVHRVLEEGWTVRRAAQAAGVSDRTTYKWLARFHSEGHSGLAMLPATISASVTPGPVTFGASPSQRGGGSGRNRLEAAARIPWHLRKSRI